jgi:REP element-mobilizing transposase RayT
MAIHVRMNHVHTVVSAQEEPAKLLNHFKSYASRELNRANIDGDNRMRWTRHGSNRYLWKPEHVRAAIEYVVRGQGEPMAVWESLEVS